MALPEIPVDLWRQFQSTIFGEKADDIQQAESFRWGVDDALVQLPPDDGTDWVAEQRRLEEEQQRRQEEQQRQIEEQARLDQEDYQRILDERAVAQQANEIAAANPLPSSYNDPTAGGTISQPLPPAVPQVTPQGSASVPSDAPPASFADTASSLMQQTFGPEPAPEAPKPLSFADTASDLITSTFGPESTVGKAASGAYETAVRGGMPDAIDIVRKGVPAARETIDTYGMGAFARDVDEQEALEREVRASTGKALVGINGPEERAWAEANPEKAAWLEGLRKGVQDLAMGASGTMGGGGAARDAIDAIKALRKAGMSEAALNAERELAMKTPMTLDEIQKQTGAVIKSVADAVLPKPPTETPAAANTAGAAGQFIGGLGKGIGESMRRADLAAAEKRMASMRAQQGVAGAEHDAAAAATPLGQQIARLRRELGQAPEAPAIPKPPLETPPAAGPQPGDNIRLPDGTRARVEEPPAPGAPRTGAPQTYDEAQRAMDAYEDQVVAKHGSYQPILDMLSGKPHGLDPADVQEMQRLQNVRDAIGMREDQSVLAQVVGNLSDAALTGPAKVDEIHDALRKAQADTNLWTATGSIEGRSYRDAADDLYMRLSHAVGRREHLPQDAIGSLDEAMRVAQDFSRPDSPYGSSPERLINQVRAILDDAIGSAPATGPRPGERVRLPDGTRATVLEGGTPPPPNGRPPAPPSGGAPLPPGGGSPGALAPTVYQPPTPAPTGQTVYQPPRTPVAGGAAPPPGGGGGRPAPPGGWPGPGAGGGLPPQVPPPPRATPAQVAAAAGASAKRGRRLNQGVNAPDSEVPARVRLVTQTTDPLAAVRWVEDMLTEPLHGKKLAQYDPQRASTHALINASGIASNRIVDELEPAVLGAAKKGLQHELPAYLEDLHQRDILHEFYRRGYEEQLAKTPNNQVAAQRAGMAKMRTREGANREMAYAAVDARLQAQEQALRRDGKWNDLQKAAQSIWDANAETLRRATRAGEVSAQDAAYYQWAYPHYVPTVPVSHLDPKGGGQVIGSVGSNLVTRGGTPYIRALDDVGTAGERLNPIAATRNAMIRGERAAARNKIAEQFVRIFDDAVQGGVIQPPTAGQTRRLWEGTEPVIWFDDGVPQRIDVPKIVADGIASSSAIQADEFANLYKRAVRGMVQNITGRRGGFFVTNFVRDARDYGFRRMAEEGPHHAIGIAGTWMDEAGKAFADIARSNANVRGLTGAASGGAAGLATTDEHDDIGTRLRRAGEGAVLGAIFLGANPTRPTGKALQYVERGGGMGGASATWQAGQGWYKALLADSGIIRNPNDLAKFMTQWGKEIATFHGLQGVNERTELIARTAASRRAERTGTPALESMITGRNASIDFDRYGTAIRAINGYIPFVGARTQGAAQFYRTLHDHPMTATATVLATVAPVVAATEAYNRANPERAKAYDDVPTYLKDSGIVVMMPWAGSDARGKRPNYLWVPSQIDAPFIMALRAAMERLPGMESSANPRSAGEIAAALASSMMPLNAESPLALAGAVMPPVVRQVAELGSNTDFYRGTAIASEFNDERASAFGRAVSGGVNELGRQAGVEPLQNVRPSHVDYLARQLPAYGDVITGASDLASPNAYKRAEDRPIQNEPFVGGLAGRFIRDTGGENLRRLREAAGTDYIRSVVAEAGMRPGDLDLNVASVYSDMPLTRDEQVMGQEAFNAVLEMEIERKQNLPAWDRPERRRELLLSAVATAKRRARSEVMREIPIQEKRERKEDAEAMKAGR